jgi:uncharacterized protein (TIGR03382 family)
VCASDAVGNGACSEPVTVQDDGTCDRCDGGEGGGPGGPGSSDEGGCSTSGGDASYLAMLFLALAMLRRRKAA